MTHDKGSSLEPNSLASYAWKTLGPREFIITAVVNGVIAWLVFRPADYVPLLGWFSLLIMCGPMCFILPALTTFFGYMNGVIARKAGRAGNPLPGDAAWFKSAAIGGLAVASLIGPTNIVVMMLTDSVWPGLLFRKWSAVAIVGVYAGVLGYVLHAIAATRAQNLKPAVC